MRPTTLGTFCIATVCAVGIGLVFYGMIGNWAIGLGIGLFLWPVFNSMAKM